MPFCAWCGNQVPLVSYAPCPRCGNPSNGAQRVAGNDSGATKTAGIVIGIIVGGLLLVAFIGIVAAIAVPNVITAQQRAKQKRTIADLRTTGTAIEMFVTDKNDYPQISSMYVAELEKALVPAYIKALPTVDGWGTALRYECWPRGKCEHYAVGSAGADREFEHESLEDYAQDTQTGNFDADIVWMDGELVQHPEGVSD